MKGKTSFSHRVLHFELNLKTGLALSCGDPSQNLTVLKQSYTTGPSIPGPTTVGSYLQIKCISGYLWPDLLTLKAMNCSKFGIWFPFHDLCVRMS